jgi:hypothetical protein
LLNKIHRDRIPGLFRDGKLLQHTIGFMAGYLGSGAGGARLYIVFDEGANSRPSILAAK